MPLPAHLSKIAAQEARKRNQERMLIIPRGDHENARKPSVVEAHARNFFAWLLRR